MTNQVPKQPSKAVISSRVPRRPKAARILASSVEPTSSPRSAAPIWQLLRQLSSVAITIGLLLVQPTCAASGSPHAAVAMLGGPKPSTAQLWTQCARLSLDNPNDQPAEWSGYIEIVGGTIISVAEESAATLQHMDTVGGPKLYSLHPREGFNSTLQPSEHIDSLVEFCVNYKEAWKVRPLVKIVVAGESQAVQADAMSVVRQLNKRDGGMFQADW
jgi:hypothetical protein